jgi:nicotinate phosphoribosyltransferase
MMIHSLFPDPEHLGLLTDLYELTMAAGYFVHGMADQRVTFELWIRHLPESRNYLVCAGLEQAVHYLQHLHFSPEEIDYLRAHPVFQRVPADWFQRLAELRFTGDLWAVPEGTVFFGGEPLLRVTGPLMEAQIVETFLMATLTFQILVASKAARVVSMARGRPIFDFGSRRAHGPQAGLLAARASYVAGCEGTSNSEAGRLLGIPTLGTQAHSWVMAFDDEKEAFRKFGQVFPTATMLIDTYDTIQGVKNALASGAAMQAVRLDSGDLLTLSRQVRRILDEADRTDVKIVASGDLNEFKIRDLLAAGAPIDLFGVGTELVTGRDEPSLSTVYKLVEQETSHGLVGRSKLSTEKETYPFAKQIYRTIGENGKFKHDLIAPAPASPLSLWRRGDGGEGEGERGGEAPAAREGEAGAPVYPAEPLLTQVMQNGQLLRPPPSLNESRARCRQQLSRLPDELLDLDHHHAYPVRVSPELEKANLTK